MDESHAESITVSYGSVNEGMKLMKTREPPMPNVCMTAGE